MPIAINGSGTVTGISVGGLPDGIVDTDMLAANAVTAAKRGAGAILQVQYGFRTSHLQTDSSSYVDTGITANITPLSTSNKILIQMCVLHGMYYSSNVDVISQVRILRGVGGTDTEIFTERTADYMRGKVDSNWLIAGQYLLHQDSPSTTSATTYKLQIRKGSTNGTVSVWAGSGVVLQEVAA